jgi:hypothetical protein
MTRWPDEMTWWPDDPDDLMTWWPESRDPMQEEWKDRWPDDRWPDDLYLTRYICVFSRCQPPLRLAYAAYAPEARATLRARHGCRAPSVDIAGCYRAPAHASADSCRRSAAPAAFDAFATVCRSRVSSRRCLIYALSWPDPEVIRWSRIPIDLNPIPMNPTNSYELPTNPI